MWRWLIAVLLIVLVAGCGGEAAAPVALRGTVEPGATEKADASPGDGALAATASPIASATPRGLFTPSPTATPEPTSTLEPTATDIPTSTPTATSTIEPTATAEPTATPDPYAGLSIASLRQERFGEEGDIEIVQQLENNGAFTRYQIAFPSDGLRVGGFMNVPVGAGSFPVIILNHGYMPPFLDSTFLRLVSRGARSWNHLPHQARLVCYAL